MPRSPDAPDRATFFAAIDAIAPAVLAEPWDNVGVILDPFGGDLIERVLLTIDLSDAVAREAIGWGADAIVAYHPPIFAGVRRLTLDDPLQRTILRLASAGIPVVSPHTALDAVAGGMSDWLAEALGCAAMLAPIAPTKARPLDSSVGVGRMGVLDAGAGLDVVVARIKAHLGLEFVRVAAAEAHREGGVITRFAVCPGAGGTLFEQVGDVDLLLTGEMRHHDVLARVARGTTVVLTDHTNCERGFLPRLAALISASLPAVRCRVSALDRDPLRVQ